MNLIGVRPFGPWPAWIWLGGFALGFALPAWLLDSRLRQRRAAVAAELPVALDLLAIAASAGLSPEQALLEASRRLRGPLGEGLQRVVADAGVGASGYAEGLRALATREDVAELRALADAWRMAQEQGLPLGPAMLGLADSVRERRRARLREEGGKAAVRMLLPVAVFIFPVFLVVLLYPAGVELLGLSG
jgi:tight adherence protein C